MLRITRKRTWPIGLLALAALTAVASLSFASPSTDAEAEAIDAPASKLSVLQPATQAARDAISREMKTRLELMALRLGLPGAAEASEIGVVRRDGNDVTVAALGGSICAFLARGIGGCGDAQRVVEGQSFGAEQVGCDGYRVLGLAPDGITSIAIDRGADGGVDETLPVVDNIYLGILEPVRTTATGLDESGESRFSVGIPLDSYAAMNEACG